MTATISVKGHASVSQKPESVLLVGTIKASQATLELALDALAWKRSSWERWLETLSPERVEFGEQRFEDQEDYDPLKSTRRMASLALAAKGVGNPQNDPQKSRELSLVQSYIAEWNIGGKSADEVLIFVDQLRLESEELDDNEAKPTSSTRYQDQYNPMAASEEMQAIYTGMLRGSTSEPEKHILFRSRANEEQLQEASRRAIQDATRQAKLLAAAADREVGSLESLHSMSIEPGDKVIHMIHRQSHMPLLKEAPLKGADNDMLSANPRPIEFGLSVHATFELAEP